MEASPGTKAQLRSRAALYLPFICLLSPILFSLRLPLWLSFLFLYIYSSRRPPAGAELPADAGARCRRGCRWRRGPPAWLRASPACWGVPSRRWSGGRATRLRSAGRPRLSSGGHRRKEKEKGEKPRTCYQPVLMSFFSTGCFGRH